VSFYVYILRCADGSYYVGHTEDLEKRIAEHYSGLVPGYTHNRRPVRLVFADAFPSREQALERERQVKGWSRAKKEALIKSNWERLKRLTKAFSGKDELRTASAQASIPSAPSTSLRAGFADPGMAPFGFAQDRLRLRSGRTASARRSAAPLQVGKLPNEMLAQLLAKVRPDKSGRVILGPGIGRDAAVIDAGGPRLLVAKSDPITFATELIGWYAVHINANDVACMGARPAWFLATILLPQGAAAELAESIFGQVLEACQGLEIELVGGHTEITYRLERPIVVGALLGEVEREGLVRPTGARPGDALLLTKGIAIEGTAVLAREAGTALVELGLASKLVEEAKGYIFRPGISVVREAMSACGAVTVHAMHDPTEGGLATALYEMAEASGLGVRVREDDIEVLPLTRDICAAAGLDALGLLASGSLLIAVAEEDCQRAVRAIEEAGVPVRRIGRLVRAEEGVIIEGHGQARTVPRFARDEVARFLAERGA